jgi:hypothetical protein
LYVSGCTCTADDGACKHATAALLFSLDSFAERHADCHTQVGTDIACKWDKPRQESHPLPFKDITLSDNTSRQARATFQPYNTESRQFDRKAWQKLAGNGVAALFLESSPSSSSSSSPVHYNPIPSLSNIKDIHTASSVASFLPFFSPSICIDIFNATIDQSTSLEWYDQRRNRITASSIHTVLHARKPLTDNSSIIQLILGNSTFIGNSSTNYGKEFESIALQKYESTMSSHQDSLLTQTSPTLVPPPMPSSAVIVTEE